jgi:hypothetical protein
LFEFAVVSKYGLGPATGGYPDFALDDDVGGTTDEKQVLNVVAPHQHKPAMAVDSCRVHDRQARLSVAATCHKRPECHAADEPHDDKNDNKQDERGKRPDYRGRELRTAYACEPIGHRNPRCRGENGDVEFGITAATPSIG